MHLLPRAHPESIVIETEKPVDTESMHEVLRQMPGVKVADEPASLTYPTSLNVTGQFDMEVGRYLDRLIGWRDEGFLEHPVFISM